MVVSPAFSRLVGDVTFYANPIAVIIMSISFIPMNGAMMPPSP
jgi:hypothetical protein